MNNLLIDANGKTRLCIVRRILRRQYGMRGYLIDREQRIFTCHSGGATLSHFFGNLEDVETFSKLLTMQAAQV